MAIKILIGGSPCTKWSIAQKNGRETEPKGEGWELFKNYLIAKQKFKPDLFLYENNKSAAQPIKDQISRELGADLMYINSALVSAQNRQRFYVFNWEVEQPEDRGILLRDILESGVVDREKSYPLLVSHQGNARDYFKKQHAQVAFESVDEPVKTLSENELLYLTRAEMNQRFIQSSESDKSNCVVANYCKGVPYNVLCEPVRIPEYGTEDKARPLTASYAYKGSGEGSLATEAFPDNPNKQVRDYVAEPVRIGDIGSSSQAHRVYSCDGKSVTINAGGGGQGGKTGLYAVPVNITEDGKAQTIKAQYNFTSVSNICCYNSTYGATGVATPTDDPPSEQFTGEGKDRDAMKRVYEVKDGLITIKGKQYPIKLKDGFYIIRKLTVTECCRLQTLPDDYCKAVSNSQAYKGLGNGWTAEVIIHILNGALKDVPRDEEIVVLSMYDGIGTGRYCLEKMGFTNVKYYAYEIDKYAMKVAMDNFPDIIQCGDAFAVREDDWRPPQTRSEWLNDLLEV